MFSVETDVAPAQVAGLELVIPVPQVREVGVGGAVLPAPRRAIGLEERAARRAVVGREVGLADVGRPRHVGPPVAAALQAGVKRRPRRQHRLPLERRTDQRPRVLVLRRLERDVAARRAIRLPLAADLEHPLELVVLGDLIRDLRRSDPAAWCRTPPARDPTSWMKPGNQLAGRRVAMAGVEPQAIASGSVRRLRRSSPSAS